MTLGKVTVTLFPFHNVTVSGEPCSCCTWCGVPSAHNVGLIEFFTSDFLKLQYPFRSINAQGTRNCELAREIYTCFIGMILYPTSFMFQTPSRLSMTTCPPVRVTPQPTTRTRATPRSWYPKREKSTKDSNEPTFLLK